MPFLINSSVASRRAKHVALRKRRRSRRSRYSFRLISRRSFASLPRPPRRSAELRYKEFVSRAHPYVLHQARRTCTRLTTSATQQNETYDHAARRTLIANGLDHASADDRSSMIERQITRPHSRRIFGALSRTQGPRYQRILGTARRSSARFAHQYRSA